MKAGQRSLITLMVMTMLLGGFSGEHGTEESKTWYTLTETCDQLRDVVRLILAWDAASGSFTGSVENTTDRIKRRVRVEVHLSNGRELGPTSPINLAPGATSALGCPQSVNSSTGGRPMLGPVTEKPESAIIGSWMDL